MPPPPPTPLPAHIQPPHSLAPPPPPPPTHPPTHTYPAVYSMVKFGGVRNYVVGCWTPEDLAACADLNLPVSWALQAAGAGPRCVRWCLQPWGSRQQPHTYAAPRPGRRGVPNASLF